jgi:hypothetical protein
MKTAEDFLNDLVQKLALPVHGTVVLRQFKPAKDGDPNWIVAAGRSADDALVVDMRKRHPKIDWSNVKERDGEWRIIRLTKTA